MTVITNRKMDGLGRIVLPMEIRTTLSLKEGDSLEICLENNKIVLLPNQYYCALCKATEDLREIDNSYICLGCKEKISNMG